MSNFKFKGFDFHDIVKDGTATFDYYKKDGVALTYENSGSQVEMIDATPGDITQSYKPFPSTAITASKIDQSVNPVTTTITAPEWARSFKCYVQTCKGPNGIKYESNQGGQRGPDQGHAGNDGIIIYSNTYTPIGSQKNFSFEISNAANAFSGIYQSNIRFGANAGGKGQDIYEAHQAQAWYPVGVAGPNASTDLIGISATTEQTYNTDYITRVSVYWFS